MPRLMASATKGTTHACAEAAMEFVNQWRQNKPALQADGTAGALAALAASHPDAETVRVGKLRASLLPLERLSSLRHLEINDPLTLDGLDHLTQISSLTIYSFPRVHSLAALGALTELRRLHLSTPPSYDASRKVHHVDSLEPLGRLRNLEWLVMRGVLPTLGGLHPLHRLLLLRQLEITHVYGFAIAEYAQLARALPLAEGHCLVPYFQATWTGSCKKCSRQRVALTAPRPRTPSVLCPVCNRDRLHRHVELWRLAATQLEQASHKGSSPH